LRVKINVMVSFRTYTFYDVLYKPNYEQILPLNRSLQIYFTKFAVIKHERNKER
jgi:hypothetical protein